MKLQTILALLSVVFLSAAANAQTELKKSELTVRRTDGAPNVYYLPGSERVLDGEYKLLRERPHEYEIARFAEGKYHGPYKYYKYDTLEEEGEYRDGWREGVFQKFFSDGKQVKESNRYSRGKRDGTQTSYFTDGKIERVAEYAAGLPVREEVYDFHTGEKLKSLQYREGKPHGPQMDYRVSNLGAFKIYSHYEDGVLTGEYLEQYLDDGSARLQGQYVNGERTGEWIENRRSLSGRGKVQVQRIKTQY